ncbi:MAG: putative ABC transport system permease protein [Cyclobacteriaceae bacterium]|jgi:putative ABC transport system permease protein
MQSVMEIRPILSAMWRNKVGACLIALQIAVTLAVVVNALFIINGRIEKISAPAGIDVDNIFTLTTVALSTNQDPEQLIKDDLAQIRAIAGVRDAIPVLTYYQSGSARADSYRGVPEPNDDLEILSNINYTDEHGLEAMGIELIEGRFFRADEISYITPDYNGAPTKVIVTETLGRKFIPVGPIAGSNIYYDTQGIPIEIIGVVSDIATGWIASDRVSLADTRYNVMLQPYLIYRSRASYLVRAEDGLLSSIMPQVEAALLESEPNRLISRMLTQSEVLERSYANDYATVVVLIVVMGLMLLITGLGIVGLASFSVRQRTRQIGTRRALGAKKRDILRYFITENIILTTLGVILGGALTYLVNYLLSTHFGSEQLDPRYLPSGMILVYLLGLIAVFGPAHKAASIPPAIATRTV